MNFVHLPWKFHCISSVYNDTLPKQEQAQGRSTHYLIYNRVSADENQHFIEQVVVDEVGKKYTVTSIDSRNVNATAQELVNECAFVVGSHTNPSLTAILVVVNIYYLSDFLVCKLRGKLDY